MDYEADTAWNMVISCIFSKTLIQLYLLRSFLYDLTYCIKEVIIGTIFFRINKKLLVYDAATAWNRVIPCNFFKTLIQMYLFYLFFYFWITVSKRIYKAIIVDINFKVLAYDAATAWNRGIPCKIIKLLIRCYFFCLLLYFST